MFGTLPVSLLRRLVWVSIKKSNRDEKKKSLYQKGRAKIVIMKFLSVWSLFFLRSYLTHV